MLWKVIGIKRKKREKETEITEAFALIGCPINEDFRADNVAKWKEHLHQLGITKLLGQVVDEKIAAFGSGNRTAFDYF